VIKLTATSLRIIGSILLLVGYFILLYVDVKLGCYFRLIGGLAMVPFCVKIKTWDIVGLQTFFATIDISKIIQLSYEN
jgi:hypothetical protein